MAYSLQILTLIEHNRRDRRFGYRKIFRILALNHAVTLSGVKHAIERLDTSNTPARQSGFLHIEIHHSIN
jgi:hypothetical protein